MKQKTIRGWHFVGDTLRDGSPIPDDGVWLPKIEGALNLCERGYHGSKHPLDALQYAPGGTLCRCEYRGEIVHGDDKFCASERRIIWRADATEMLDYFARMQAVAVAHRWDARDVVLDFLMTGNESLRARAYASARDSARYSNETYAYVSAYASDVHKGFGGRIIGGSGVYASVYPSVRARAYARANFLQLCKELAT